MAAAGVGTIGIVDGDTVDLSNLQRQGIHHTADLAHPKVASAANRMRAINPDITIHPFRQCWNRHVTFISACASGARS